MSRSSRQKRSQQYAVSLFPFLAVLVCTLGVLIVMLVMAVQAADVENRQQRDETAAQQKQLLKEAEERQGLAEFDSESILSVRGDLTSRLRDAKGDRSYLEQQINDTNRQVEDIFKAISNLKSLIDAKAAENNAEVESTSDDDLDRLRTHVAEAEKTLEQLREDKSFETKSEYAIVPFTGSGGTHRQPIFVECVSDGIVLQPYNIKLKQEDFSLPLSIGNMLDSALLTVREYWEKHGLASTDSKPYPLLVVRPDGAASYGLARRAMKSWDDEFGYELVDSDLKLRFGQPDLLLKSEIEAAVEVAKQRQQRQVRRRQLHQDDQWKSNLQLARGLKPSASGGFEFTDTGRPAHELFSKGGQSKTANNGSSEPLSKASFNKSATDFQASEQKPNQAFTANDDLTSSSADAYRQVGLKDLRSRQRERNQSQGQTGQQGQAGQQGPQSENGNSSVSGGSSSLANSRGANWALPAETSGARAYVRPIRLICEPDKISIVSQNVVTATVPMRNRTVAAIDPLVSEIWKTIEVWGLAGSQAYWKPELRFSVVPGAERRFQELRVLLDGSGLLVEKR